MEVLSALHFRICCTVAQSRQRADKYRKETRFNEFYSFWEMLKNKLNLYICEKPIVLPSIPSSIRRSFQDRRARQNGGKSA